MQLTACLNSLTRQTAPLHLRLCAPLTLLVGVHRADGAVAPTIDQPSLVPCACVLRPVGVVYSAEAVNRFAGENWETFAGQNYFDRRGVFTSVMFSVPLLCAALFVLLNALRSASRLLISVKRKQIRSEIKAKKKGTKAE